MKRVTIEDPPRMNLLGLIRDRLNPAWVDTFKRVRGALDPQGIMAPRCWPLG